MQQYSVLLICLLALGSTSCLISSVAAARNLKEAGDVESKTTIYLDPNGGVPPLADRLEAALQQNEKRFELVLAEADCKKDGDLKCKEVKEIKKEIAEDKKDPPADEKGDCYQNIFWSYFLGTVCDLPPDSKKDGNDRPAKDDKDSRRRSLLGAWW